MRSALALLLAVGVLSLARALAPAELPLRTAEEREAAVLGPLRPVVAELMLLRAEQRWRAGDRWGTLEVLRRVLALRPDVPALWAEFGARMMLDIPRERSDPREQLLWYGWGHEVILEGLRRHPRSAVLWLAMAQGVCVAADVHPLRLAVLAEPERWRELVLDAAARAEDGLGGSGVVHRQAFELQVRMACELLEQGQGEGADAARGLLGRTTDPELRARLAAALESSDGGC